VKKFVDDLSLQIDQKVWRFAFPESLIKKLPEPQGLCVTNNHILWRLFEPLTSWNGDKGTDQKADGGGGTDKGICPWRRRQCRREKAKSKIG
jgi:hypothetical protein